MKRFSLVFSLILICFSTTRSFSQATSPEQAKKIQVAILLDVSGSMDGLIEQAKSQLWNMVTVLGKAKCGTQTPNIEIALYEYGRTTNDKNKGYVKQLSGFTTDLDKLSEILFSLRTDGGDEFCGHVIKASLDELAWDASPGNYKVIFIAGNEDFLQGSVRYTESCSIAKQKGVIVNTIYCGNKQQGIKEHWNIAGECGNGSFSNIDQNGNEDDIFTPYDSMMYSMNAKLNGTYIGYGSLGYANLTRMEDMDNANAKQSNKAGLTRAYAKADKNVYRNAGWDLFDADVEDSTFIDRLDFKTLPDSLQNKTKAELKEIIKKKGEERAAVQKEMGRLNTLRTNYIADERKKRATEAGNAATLETEIEKVLKEQAKRFNIKIE